MASKHRFIVALAITAALLLASCTPGVNPTTGLPGVLGTTAGFWTGLWRGFISPVTFIISLFSKNVSIYEVHNNGNWYNFGFMLGISMILGGGASGARRRSKRK
jgi:hypothetical protein